jgi:hypothetical protein
MARSDDSTVAGLVKQMQAAATLNPMFRPHVEEYWKAQEKVLREAETFAEHWFHRRHIATKTALDVVHDVTNGGSDPSGALRTMSDWQRHSTERVIEDFREWVELCMRCAGHVTSAETKAEREGLEKASEQVAAGSKTKHATPV